MMKKALEVKISCFYFKLRNIYLEMHIIRSVYFYVFNTLDNAKVFQKFFETAYKN